MTTEKQPIDMENMGNNSAPALTGREVNPDRDEAPEQTVAPKISTDGITEAETEKLNEVDGDEMKERIIKMLRSGELHQPGRSRDPEAYNAYLEAEKRVRDRNRSKVKSDEKKGKLPYTNK